MAATAYTGTVFCPTIVPAGRTVASESSRNHTSRTLRHRSYHLEVMSRHLMHRHGRDVHVGGGHWTVSVGTDPVLQALLRAPNARRRPRSTTVHVEGRSVRVYKMPPSPEGGCSGGHVVIDRT